ncbi:MAG: LPS-assembly protein LptD [Treponema sp.]|nr:LPS-assembly protein LptD [Treponema sp.]
MVKFLLVGHLLFFLFSASVMNLYAQEEPPPEAPPPDEKPPAVEVRALSPEQNRIDMDIRTSTLSELAAWCRSLGLPEGGTGADLAKRLREYFKIADQKQQDAQAAQGEDKRKIITIESARSTEYFRIEAVDEDYARLSGEVKISLKDGNSTHHIRAWNILFNRTRNILTATGGVEYIKGEGDKVETFRGESITVDLDNWSSVFMGGVSERSLQGDSTTYQFAGTVISRDEEEVIVLSKASIKSANNEESLWSLSATRVWLLPGSDFAIFNAVLKVGEIPVLYIPFFYYPADELIFHPVIGYRTREGNFVQTTTYIMGRPKANTATQSSLTKILGNSNDMEKKREGLYLRSTGKKAIDPNTTSLRAIVDYYSNLGTYIGTDLELPAKGILSALNLSLGIGVTRTVVQDGGNYTPYFPDYDGSSDWNSSSLFSKEVPFRYRLKTNSSIGGKYGSFSWTILYYSDPLVDSDFLNRAEEMDWVNMLQKGAAMEEDELAQNQLGSYTWQFSGQVNPNFSKMSPYINSITINNISSTVSFRTVDKKSSYLMTDIKYYSPSSFFYAPDTATLYSMSGTIAGTPLSFGGSAVSQTNSQTSETERPDPLKNIGVPRSPFEDKVKEDTKKKDQTDKLVPPELSQRFDLPRTGSIKTSLDYRIAPSGASTLKFNYNKWKEFNQIDWGDVSSILNNFSGDASTTVNVNHSENFFSNSFSYSGSGTWRQYGYLNEEAEEYLTAGVTDPAKVDNAKLQEYRSSSFSTSYNLSSTLRPLYQNPVFASSSLQYSLKGLAVKSKFDEKKSTADNPHWELEYGEWDRKKIDIHQATANLSALIMDKTQTLSFTADLPPKDSALAWRTGIRVWITETDANWRMRYPSKEEIQKGTDDRWKLEPFNATERLNFGAFGSFSQSLVLDTEGKELTSLTSALNFTKWGLTINYTASRMLGYEYIPKGSDKDNLAFEGWRTRKGEAKAGDPNYLLRSRDFSVNYSKNFSMKELWNNRLQFTVNTSSRLFFDLQRYTNSNFTFTLGFTLGINKFLDLSLSTSSENVSIYRYFRNMPFFSDAPIVIPDGPQNNLFFDLLNSFRFDDDKLRESSGFKMKNFRAAATHYMGDWNAILSWTMSPYRPVNKRQYEINNEVSFLLQWMPINEIKTDVSYNKSKTPEWTVK